MHRKGKKKNIIPVGLVRKIKPNVIPDRIENLLYLSLSKYHLVKKSKFRVTKEVSDKSIK